MGLIKPASLLFFRNVGSLKGYLLVTMMSHRHGFMVDLIPSCRRIDPPRSSNRLLPLPKGVKGISPRQKYVIEVLPWTTRTSSVCYRPQSRCALGSVLSFLAREAKNCWKAN